MYYDKKLPPPHTAPDSDFKLDAYYKLRDVPRKDFEMTGDSLSNPWITNAFLMHMDLFVLRYQGNPILTWGPVKPGHEKKCNDHVEWHITPTNALIDRLNQRLPPGVRPMPHNPKYDVSQPTAEEYWAHQLSRLRLRLLNLLLARENRHH